MCINLTTSIVAFLIGEISGFILTRFNNEKRAIGIFIMLYSLVQLCEALIYYNIKDVKIVKDVSRVLLIDLGLQGTVFFTAINYFFKVNPIYFIICGFISLYSIWKAFINKFISASYGKCLKWNFMSYDINILLVIMYFLIFLWMITSTSYILRITSFILIFTFLISYIFPGNNSPSMWCLTSAIVAPIVIFI